MIVKNSGSGRGGEQTRVSFSEVIDSITIFSDRIYGLLEYLQKPNLILNVDGAIGVIFVDILRHSGMFTASEAQETIEIGALNGLFVLGRSLGFIGLFCCSLFFLCTSLREGRGERRERRVEQLNGLANKVIVDGM